MEKQCKYPIKTALLLAIDRRFADPIDALFGPTRRQAVCGHSEIEHDFTWANRGIQPMRVRIPEEKPRFWKNMA